MTNIFVSYSRKDIGFVARLTHDLELRQANVWWDRRLAPGEKFVDKILQQIKNADYVLAIHSEHSSSSKWVALEMGAILTHEINNPSIMQLLSVDVSDLPQWIANRNALPMYDPNYEEGLSTLCDAIELNYHIDEKSTNSGRADEHLKVFQAGQQWMELLRGQHGLDCILINADEQVARVQWTMSREKLREIQQQPESITVRGSLNEDRPWGTFDIGSRKSWRWSPHLMDTDNPAEVVQEFERKLREFLS